MNYNTFPMNNQMGVPYAPTFYPTYGRGYMNNYMNNMGQQNYMQPAQQNFLQQPQQGYMQQAPGTFNNNGMMNNQQGTPQVYCRMVTSEEEARSAMIELDGSLYIFTDVPHKRIYTKQLEMDGTAPLRIYYQVDSSQPAVEQVQVAETNGSVPAQTNYATKNDVDTILGFYDSMEKQMAEMREDIDFLFKDKEANNKKKSSLILEDK